MATILTEKGEEKHSLARKKIQEILPNNSTKKVDLFHGDIFHNQEVHVGDCHHWSRHLVAETRSPAEGFAVPTKGEEPSEMKIRPTGLSSVEPEEVDEFTDMAVLAEDMMLAEPKEDKSIRRHFVNWLNGVLHARRMMTRAETEPLILLDKQIQSVEKLLDANRQAQRYLKHKAEERTEKWVVEHDLSAPASSPEQPNKRTSKWEKRFLRAKEFFSRQSNCLEEHRLLLSEDTE